MSEALRKKLFDEHEARRKQKCAAQQIAHAEEIAKQEQALATLKKNVRAEYEPKIFQPSHLEGKFGDSDSEFEEDSETEHISEIPEDPLRKAKRAHNKKFNALYDRLPSFMNNNCSLDNIKVHLQKQNIFESTLCGYYENVMIGEYSDEKDSFLLIDCNDDVTYFKFSNDTKRRMLKSWIKRDFHFVADEFEQEVARLGQMAESSFASNHTSLIGQKRQRSEEAVVEGSKSARVE